jgi:hypothetical protein
VANASSGTFFVTLKEWGERTRTEEHTKPIQARWNWDRGTLSEGIVFILGAAIPGSVAAVASPACSKTAQVKTSVSWPPI